MKVDIFMATKNKRRYKFIFALLGCACLFYAMAVAMVGSGTFSFVIWLALAAFFGLCFLLAGERWARTPRAIRVAAYIVIGVGFALFVACQTAIAFHFHDEGEPDLDYIIVLGAQVRESGPALAYRYRLESAAAYLTENPETVCITTGGRGSNEPISEGEGGSDYLERLGVPAARIIAETASTDTSENIKNALELIRARESGEDSGLRIGIVTNNFHVYRGVHIAAKLTDSEIYGIAAYSVPFYLPNNLVRESFGICRDFITGKI